MKSAVLVLLASCVACTNAELCVMPCEDPPKASFDDAVQLAGDVCTVPPASVNLPYKILFVIDHSGSNGVSDPQDNRVKAVQRVIEQYRGNPSVWFGIIRFSAQPERLTAGFTQDADGIISSAIPRIAERLDGTNYLEAMGLMTQFLADDMRSLTTGELARTRYDVQFLSDGEPAPCVPVASVEAATEQMVALKNQFRPFDLRLSTTRLAYEGFSSVCIPLGDAYGDPTAYLQPMAELGGGTFQNLASNELKFDIGFVEIKRRYESHELYVVNTSRVVMDDGIWADSDRDGIRDQDDPHPYTADFRRDGCGDRVDEELRPNDGLCESQCAALGTADRDNDGIPDCAEVALGYDPTSPDTDKDGFPDDVELRFGTNPLDSRTTVLDSDHDGVSDAQEMRTGTNPRYPDTVDDWRYIYGSIAPTEAEDAGTSCFGVDIDNIRLVETVATADTLQGDNVICVYMTQTPIDDPAAPATITRTCRTLNYRRTGRGDTKNPPTGNVALDPKDLEIVYR